MIEKPDGLTISAFFIAGIIVVSLISRVSRTTELRAARIEFDATARRFIADSLAYDNRLHVVANKRQRGSVKEYRAEERAQRAINPVPRAADILFLEIDVVDPSQFSQVLRVHGVEVDGYRVLRASSPPSRMR